MLKLVTCGSGSFHRAAMTVAIVDVIFTSVLLILFVLGSSLMVAFEFVGSDKNATRVLDEITDEVLGTRQQIYTTYRERKDVAEDMGVFLIIMFLTIVDFIISCIFVDGVKSKNPNKCQVWFNIRIVLIVVFKIIVIINLFYGSSWLRCIPDLIFTVYRVAGLLIGHAYLKELRAVFTCRNCSAASNFPDKMDRINLSGRRKEVEKAVILDSPVVKVTGPEEKQLPSLPTSPAVTITRKISPSFLQPHAIPDFTTDKL